MHYFYEREDMQYVTDDEFDIYFKKNYKLITIEFLQEILDKGKIYKNEYIDGGTLTDLQKAKIKERINYLETKTCIIC